MQYQHAITFRTIGHGLHPLHPSVIGNGIINGTWTEWVGLRVLMIPTRTVTGSMWSLTLWWKLILWELPQRLIRSRSLVRCSCGEIWIDSHPRSYCCREFGTRRSNRNFSKAPVMMGLLHPFPPMLPVQTSYRSWARDATPFISMIWDFSTHFGGNFASNTFRHETIVFGRRAAICLTRGCDMQFHQ